MTDFDAVCFDAGDTLLFDKPSRNERIAAALTLCGVGFSPESLREPLQRLDSEALAMYLSGREPDDPAALNRLAEGLLLGIGVGGEAASALVDAYLGQPYTRMPDPAAAPLLLALRARSKKLAVVSDWGDNLKQVLDEIGFGGFFDAISASAVVGARKPSPLLFQDALQKLGVAPERAVHVGDYLQLDVLAARQAGMQAILFDRYGRCRASPPDVLVAFDFDDLSRMLLDRTVS